MIKLHQFSGRTYGMSTDWAANLKSGRSDYLPCCSLFHVGRFVKFCFSSKQEKLPWPSAGNTDVYSPQCIFLSLIFQTISHIA